MDGYVYSTPGDAFAAAFGRSGGRALLLVVDNCKHLIDDVVELVDAILSSGTECRVLATAREALEIDGPGLKSLVEVCDRLDHRFRLLVGGQRRRLQRQHTLQTVMDWSWDPLTQDL
jgi:predicted ATPase